MKGVPGRLRPGTRIGMGNRRAKGFYFILPSLVLVIVVFLYPIAMVIRNAFLEGRVFSLDKISLVNFKILLIDEVFFLGLRNNFLLFILAIPILLFLSVVIALLLFERIRGWIVYRFFIFLPYVLSIVVVGVAFSVMLQKAGIVNYLLTLLGLQSLALDWIGSPRYALFSVLFVIIWKTLGFGVVVFNSRLLSMDIELLEAAQIDGASWLQKHFFVTIPTLRSVIEFYIVITLVNMLSWVFGYIYVLTYGGPGNSTVVTEYYIYTQLFHYNQLGVASAATIFMLLFTFLLIFLQLRISRAAR